jgi:hypothetical protein
MKFAVAIAALVSGVFCTDPNALPAPIAPPNARAQFVAQVTDGVQNYRCDAATGTYTGIGANANLERRIVHFFQAPGSGPTWKRQTGQFVGTNIIKSPVAGQIAWLQLSRDPTLSTQNGLGRFDFVTRFDTSGGLPPTGTPCTVGEVVKVPYGATYGFYKVRRSIPEREGDDESDE